MNCCSSALTRLRRRIVATLAVLASLAGLATPVAASQQGPGDGLPGEMWSALSRLTHLSLHARLLAHGASVLQSISCLARLRELSLVHCAVLPAALSGLQQLTALTLTRGSLEPAALACVSQLQLIHLQGTASLPAGAAGVAALLAQLGALQQLVSLRITGALRDPAPAACVLRADSQQRPDAPGAVRRRLAARRVAAHVCAASDSAAGDHRLRPLRAHGW